MFFPLLLLLACPTPKPDTGAAPPVDADGDGWTGDQDCDDANPTTYPGAPETCDGRDDDCDGFADDGVTPTWYVDADGDGWGDPDASVESCSPRPGHVADGTDCDDGDPGVFPGAPEVCDGRDQDCDGTVDDGVTTPWYADADGDNWGDPSVSTDACRAPRDFVADSTDGVAFDCDDGDPAVFPGAPEVCDGRDQDCDGTVDDGVTTPWYADADGDGWGDPSAPTGACLAPTGFVGDATDCDDGDLNVYPGAPEICDGRDQDCDGATDEDGLSLTVFGGWPGPSVAHWGSFSHALFLDLNGDGLLDLATCTDDLRWALNPGSPWVLEGEWDLAQSRIEGEDVYCEDLDTLDVDDDGDPDLVAPFDDGALRWFRNNGLGGLELAGTLATPVDVSAYGMAVGDFDGDGATDLVTPNLALWNEGGGAFTEAESPTGRAYQQGLVLRDDGAASITTTSATYQATPWREWLEVPRDDTCHGLTVDQGPRRSADLDGDGHGDALLFWTDLVWCAGDGMGALAWGESLYGLATDTVSVTNLADVDGDGWTDFVLTDETDATGDLHRFRGGPDGFTLAQTLRIPDSTFQGALALYEDVDGDGAEDLVAIQSWSDDLAWYPSDGAGGFRTAWAGHPGSNLDFTATAADVDGDGLQDVVALSEENAWVFLGRGDREFALREPVDVPDSRSGWDLWPGGLDLDGDGDQEVVAWYYDERFVLDWDAAAGNLAVQTGYTGPDEAYDHAADLDGDGDPELLTECAASEVGDYDYDGEIEFPEAIWLGGVGEEGLPMDTWRDLVLEVGSDTVLAVSLEADLTGDGLVDLALLDAAGVRVWSWDGATFGETVSSDLLWAEADADLESRRWMAPWDADGDGDADLLLALPGEGATRVLANDGAGRFTLGTREEAPADLVDPVATVGDWTGDGRLEAWLLVDETSGGWPRLQAWRQGLAGWDTLPDQTPPVDYGLTLRDVDGDGAPDLVGGGRDRAWIVWGVEEEVAGACP